MNSTPPPRPHPEPPTVIERAIALAVNADRYAARDGWRHFGWDQYRASMRHLLVIDPDGTVRRTRP